MPSIVIFVLAEAPALAQELSPLKNVEDEAVPVVPNAVSNSAKVAVIVLPEKAIDLFVNVVVEEAVTAECALTFQASPVAVVLSSTKT